MFTRRRQQLLRGVAAGRASVTPSDPNWANVVLLLNQEATDAKQNQSFVDESSSSHTVTPSGDVTQGSFSAISIGDGPWSAASHGGSAYFDGTGDELSLPTSSDWAPGTGEYTFEAWVYPTTSGANRGIFSTEDGSAYGIDIWHNGTSIYFDERQTSFSGSDPRITGTLTLNAWNHISMCRETGTGGTLRAFVDGVQAGSTTANLRDLTNTDLTKIGNTPASASNFAGYIGPLIFKNGTCDRTGAFTPPTSPYVDATNVKLLLNFTNAGIYDAAAKNIIILAGSQETDTAITHFNPASVKTTSSTADYGFIAGDSFPDIGTADFTFKCWIYPTSVSGNGVFFDGRGIGGVTTNTILIYRNGSSITFNTAGADRITGGSISINTWNWVAVTRESQVNRLWVNGTYIGTYTDSISMTFPSNRPTTGGNGYSASSDHFAGYMEDMQMYIGYAEFTGTSSISVPSTAPPIRG